MIFLLRPGGWSNGYRSVSEIPGQEIAIIFTPVRLIELEPSADPRLDSIRSTQDSMRIRRERLQRPTQNKSATPMSFQGSLGRHLRGRTEFTGDGLLHVWRNHERINRYCPAATMRYNTNAAFLHKPGRALYGVLRHTIQQSSIRHLGNGRHLWTKCSTGWRARRPKAMPTLRPMRKKRRS